MLHFFAKRFNALQEVKRDERGFTLIELLVVIIIIGILAAIAIPAFLAQRERAWEANTKSDLRNAAAAATTCAADNDGNYTNCDLATLKSTYDFNQSDDVNFTDVTPATNTWSARAVNSNGGDPYYFSSDTGIVTVTT